MKLRTILFTGFLGMAAITLIIGVTAFLMSNVTLKANQNVIALSKVESDLLTAISAHNKWKASLEESFIENLDGIHVQLDGHECGFGNWFYKGGLEELKLLSPEIAEIITLVEQSHLNLHKTAEKMNETWKQIHPGLNEELYRRLSDHNAWATNLIEDILQGRVSDAEIDHRQCGFGLFLASDWNKELEKSWPEYKRLIDPIKIHHENLHQAVITINNTPDVDEKYKLFVQNVTPELAFIKDSFQDIILMEQVLVNGQSSAKYIFNNETSGYLNDVELGINETINQIGKEKSILETDANKLNIIQNIVIWIGIGLGVLIGIIVAVFITRSITRKLGGEPAEISIIAENIAKGNLDLKFDERNAIGIFASMKNMTSSLTEIVSSVLAGSEQIAAASEELASGNQDLSNRTEQQASALEETSSAIEEMSASVKSNADSTASADKLSRDAVQKTELGSDSVKKMVTTMNEINDSSNRISDIIEVINNIAFQTNLLALNASIEAARAGEQGKGFAVVAVEVRKLAKRSDRAAREIADIIKESGRKVEEGVDVASSAGSMLEEINSAVKKVTALVAEISAASQEQLSSVEQIDQTLTSLDENTQKNAAMVEEAASATEELSSQAQELNSTIQFFKIGHGTRLNKQKTSVGVRLMRDTKTKNKKQGKSSEIESETDSEGSYETFSNLASEGEFDEF
ncbi:MAG: hypothetical protein JEZ04_09770 [Spirochaetales bacterium]|nr:hypothetical protein [Spirochaetales bacterium]